MQADRKTLRARTRGKERVRALRVGLMLTLITYTREREGGRQAERKYKGIKFTHTHIILTCLITLTSFEFKIPVITFSYCNFSQSKVFLFFLLYGPR